MHHDEGGRNDVIENGGKKRERETKLILEKKNKRYIGSFEYRVNRFRSKSEREREPIYARCLSEYR